MFNFPLVDLIAWPATLLGIYALWVVGWSDFLRLVQGVRYTRGIVVRHVSSASGLVPVYEFGHDGIMREATGRVGHTSPQPPVGSSSPLSYPKRRPDLARTPEPFARSIMYAGFAAWLGFFTDLLFRWIG